MAHGHEHPHPGPHTHGVSADADARKLAIALALIVAFMTPDVEGAIVLVVALVGIVVNLAAARLIASAERRSLNIEGAFQHILTDLFAFIAPAVAGVLILTAD